MVLFELIYAQANIFCIVLFELMRSYFQYVFCCRLAKMAELVAVQERDDFLRRLYAYWQLKRHSRFGVPLLRRLATPPQSTSIVPMKQLIASAFALTGVAGDSQRSQSQALAQQTQTLAQQAQAQGQQAPTSDAAGLVLVSPVAALVAKQALARRGSVARQLSVNAHRRSATVEVEGAQANALEELQNALGGCSQLRQELERARQLLRLIIRRNSVRLELVSCFFMFSYYFLYCLLTVG